MLDRAHGAGLLGITLPEACGGAGQDMTALCVVLGRIGAADASLGGIIFTDTLAQEIMLAAGCNDVLKEIMGQAAGAGPALIAYPAFCNPGETGPLPEAVKTDGLYKLNGAAGYVVLGGLANHALVPARMQGRDGYSFFLIDHKDGGLGRSSPVVSLGLHACPAVDLTLEGVEGMLIGEEGAGARYFGRASDRMHAAVAALQCGIMKGAFDEALAYSRERFQGGWPIINWSGLRILLGDMAVQVRVADMTAAMAALAVEQRYPQWGLSARAAALHLSDMACRLTTDGIQVLGGNGYMKDYGQEKRFRDAKQVQALLGLSPLRKLGLVSAMADD